MLMFDVKMPEYGDKAGINAMPLLREIALSEAERTAESIHQKRTEITAETVINRLLKGTVTFTH
jgi:hypothetical protein